MRSVYQIFNRILGYITGGAAAIAGLSVLATAFIICYEILARGLFHKPTSWAMEVSTYLLILAGFFGMAYTMRTHGHICVDFLYSRFPKALRRGLDVLTSLLSLFAIYVCMTESTNYMLMSYTMEIVSPSLLRVPLWIPQCFMLIGFVLLFLEIANHFLADFFGDEDEKEAQ